MRSISLALRSAALFVVLALAAQPSSARGQEPAVSASDAEARALFQAGREAFAAASTSGRSTTSRARSS